MRDGVVGSEFSKETGVATGYLDWFLLDEIELPVHTSVIYFPS